VKYLRTVPLLLLILTAAALSAACGDDDESGGNGGEATTRAATSPTEDEGENGSPTDGAGGGDSVELEITAENTTFDETELTAPAGVDVTLIYDNDDEGLEHLRGPDHHWYRAGAIRVHGARDPRHLPLPVRHTPDPDGRRFHSRVADLSKRTVGAQDLRPYGVDTAAISAFGASSFSIR
jgi:hypothetical protein